jgi:hypothetical protein
VSDRGSQHRRVRDLLVKDLTERLLTALEAGNPTGLLDPAVPGLAETLAGILTTDRRGETAPAVEAASTLVGVHWIRYQLLPQGQDQDDLLDWPAWPGPASCCRIAPDRVPDPVGAHLTTAGTPAGASSTAAEATTRAIALMGDHQQTGNMESLQAAATQFQEAVATTPVYHPDRPGMLSNLRGALRARFARTGVQSDLDEPITVGRDAVVTTPVDHPDRPAMLSNLGAALRIRFEWIGQQTDLDEAITVGRDAVATSRSTTPIDPRCCPTSGSRYGSGSSGSGSRPTWTRQSPSGGARSPPPRSTTVNAGRKLTPRRRLNVDPPGVGCDVFWGWVDACSGCGLCGLVGRLPRCGWGCPPSWSRVRGGDRARGG